MGCDAFACKIRVIDCLIDIYTMLPQFGKKLYVNTCVNYRYFISR